VSAAGGAKRGVEVVEVVVDAGAVAWGARVGAAVVFARPVAHLMRERG